MQRRTTQREKIQQVFRDAGRPLDVPEAHALASKQLPKLGIATVYRAVNALVADAFLKTVEMPGEAARYELADLDHHHHFHCTGCGKVFDIEGCALKREPAVPAGFEVESHEIILYGRCASCRRSG